MRKQCYQAALGNCYGLKLPAECSLRFKKKITVPFIIIFDALSFHVPTCCLWSCCVAATAARTDRL